MRDFFLDEIQAFRLERNARPFSNFLAPNLGKAFTRRKLKSKKWF